MNREREARLEYPIKCFEGRLTLDEIRNPKWEKYNANDKSTYPPKEECTRYPDNVYWVTYVTKDGYRGVAEATFLGYMPWYQNHMQQWDMIYDSASFFDDDVVVAYSLRLDTTPIPYQEKK